ncbi:MAG: MFS transporter [Candidatus Dormibacteraeota bacterium]|nr:MFS transporter [Candidatus Dormibacteraeota bacterium]
MAETAPASAGAPAARRSWWTLVAVCGASFMLLVDVTIVQVALPSVQRELSGSFSDLEWVISAYALTLAALILSSGSLADRFGRQRIFAAGIVIFTVFSLVCGLSTTSTMLIAARAAQGVGGAAMFATSLALIGQEYRGEDRFKALAFWSATIGGAVSAGPLLGGVLTGWLGWRWIFFINLPIGVVTLLLALTRIPNVHDPEAKRLDVSGLVTFSLALFFLIFALIRGDEEGWASAQVLGSFAGAAILLGVFAYAEHHQARPMFDLSLFRKPAFSGVNIATFAIGAGMFAMFLYITLYLQTVLGYSPLQGGLRVLPITSFAFIVPLVSRRFTERMAPGVVLGSAMLLVAAGLSLMHGLTTTSDWTSLLPGMIVGGIGIGLANPAIARIALGVVPPQRSGMASGINNTFRIAGLATGVALLGAIFQQVIAASLTTSLGRPAGALAQVVASTGTQSPAVANNPAVTAIARRAFLLGLNDIFIVGAFIALAGAVAAFSLIRGRDVVRAAQRGPGTAEPAAVAMGG